LIHPKLKGNKEKGKKKKEEKGDLLEQRLRSGGESHGILIQPQRTFRRERWDIRSLEGIQPAF